MELIGAKLESINKAEDRELFANVSGRVGNELSVMSWLLGGAGGRPWLAGRLAAPAWRAHADQHSTAPQPLPVPPPACPPPEQAMEKLGLGMAVSRIGTTMEECMKAAEEIGRLPLIIRPAFTLGGTGGGIAYNMDEFA